MQSKPITTYRNIKTKNQLGEKMKLATHLSPPRQDRTRQDKTGQDKTREDKTREDKTRDDKTRGDMGLGTGHMKPNNGILHVQNMKQHSV